jgi:hypothetical protein
MSARAVSFLGLTIVLLCGAAVAQAHNAASPRALSPVQAQTRAKRGTNTWIRGQDLPVIRFVNPKCTQLGSASWQCVTTVYCNAAGTIPYAKLTIHVWNTAVAPNGAYWSHERLVASYRVLC